MRAPGRMARSLATALARCRIPALLALLPLGPLPCHAADCAFWATEGGETRHIALPNVKFNNWNNKEITTGILMNLYLNANGTVSDSSGEISGSWDCNYLQLKFNISYLDYIDDNTCFSSIPVQLRYQGHATVSVTGGAYSYSGRGMVVSQTWPYTYSNCPTVGTKTITVNDRPFTLAGAIPRAANGGPGDNNQTVFEGGDGPGAKSCSGLPNYWINTATLNLFVEDRVCMYPGRGPQLPMTHSYNADPASIGMFGTGWGFAYECTITKTKTGVYSHTATLRKGTGQELEFLGLIDESKPPPIRFNPATGNGNHDKLSWMGDHWLWTEKDTKWTYRFDKSVTGGVTSEAVFRLSSITDPSGNQLAIVYTPDNLIQTITDASGRTTTFTYDGNRRVSRMDTPDGRFATYEYDVRGLLVRTVDLLGTQTLYTYDAAGRMTSLSAAGRTTQFRYAEVAGIARVSAVIDANGKTTSYTMSGTTVTKTDPLGHNTVYSSTSKFFTSSVTDPLGNIRSIVYTAGNPVTHTDALGRQITKSYDQRGNVLRITDATGNSTDYAYDANDNMTGITNALGKTWSFTYDAQNKLTNIASPLNRQTAMEYDANGQLTGITDPGGRKTAFTYTAHGNLATMTDPLGHQTQYEYDSLGMNITAVTDPRGNKSSFRHDANNRLTGVTNPDGSSRTYTYDCPCGLTGVTDENGNTTNLKLDKVLNLAKITDPLGGVTEMGYDANSNLVLVRDALAQETSNTYDQANRRVRNVNPLAGAVGYSYDANGNLTTLADERSKQTKFGHDGNGNVVTSTDPLNEVTQFVRDELGRIKQIVHPESGEISYIFDDDGRVAEKYFGPDKVATFGYDSNGNLTSVVDPLGSSAHGYGSRNEVTDITWQDGASASFTHDQAGNPSGIQYPGGLAASYQYDSRDRVRNVTWGGVTITFDYDLAGNLVKETRSNGTVSDYAYDATDRLTGFNHRKGTVSFAQRTYLRDAAGNIVRETGTTWSPPPGATLNLGGVYNDANQIVSWGTDSYSYDKAGNLKTVAGSRPMTAGYDPENRLLSLSLAGTTATYGYDGLGTRVSKTQGAATTKYHYDHLGRLLFETNQAGTVIASYCYAGALLVAMRAEDGAFYYYHFDKTGNTLALTDASGNVANSYQYDPFGQVTAQTGTVRNPFTYVGAYGVMQEGNGIFYMKNRYYDAVTGRFLQKDPIGFAGGQSNLYAYVGNNPVMGIDPEGLIGGVPAGSALEAMWLEILKPTVVQTMSQPVKSSVRREVVKVSLSFLGYSLPRAAAAGAVGATAAWSLPGLIAVYAGSTVVMIVVEEFVCTKANLKGAGHFYEGLRINANSVVKEAGYFGRGIGESLKNAGFKETSYFWRGLLGY